MARSGAAAGALALLALVATAQGAAAVDPAAPVLGRWITVGRDGVFRIDRCGAALCGRLVGMRYTGSMPLDFRKAPQCDQALLGGFVPTAEPGHWAGHIEDPDSGHVYKATIWSPKPDQLRLRGYLLLPIFGQTQSWTRYSGGIGPACKLPD